MFGSEIEGQRLVNHFPDIYLYPYAINLRLLFTALNTVKIICLGEKSKVPSLIASQSSESD